MIIEMSATENTEIRDLGIIISTGETINLLDNFNKEIIINSNDLESAMNMSIIVTVDGESLNYNELIRRISNITNYEHYNLNQLQHNMYEDNFFKVTKNEGTTKYITYYFDDSMINKIQEDEIIRDTSGRVERVITRNYENGVVEQEMIQYLNRDINGKVESITTNTQ